MNWLELLLFYCQSIWGSKGIKWTIKGSRQTQYYVIICINRHWSISVLCLEIGLCEENVKSRRSSGGGGYEIFSPMSSTYIQPLNNSKWVVGGDGPNTNWIHSSCLLCRVVGFISSCSWGKINKLEMHSCKYMMDYNISLHFVFNIR